MEASADTYYQPPAGFVEEKKEPLIDLELTNSTELWLIQWPINEPPDFDGQQVSLDIKGNGHMGTFEGLSGKSYDVFKHRSQGPEATVFLSSASEAKIAAKISHTVSLIHYPKPSELKKRKAQSHSQGTSMATSTISGRGLTTPSRRIRHRDTSTPSSRMKSIISGSIEPSKKKHKMNDQRRSTAHSTQLSDKGNSGITSTSSMEHSQGSKLKKARKSQS